MDHLKKIWLTATGACAALFATIALAQDPITEFLLHSNTATARVPPAPRASSAAQAATASAASGDDSLVLEPEFDGREKTSEDVARRFQEVKGLMDRVCSQPSNQPYFAKTPCIATSLSDSQASDTSKATAQEVQAARRVFRQIDAINEKTRKIMIASGQDAHEDAVRSSQTRLDPKVKENQDALLTGRRSWGEYNRARLELTRRIR